jgi:PadR family transcriptional regulator, regulatory protein PadR
MVNMNQCPCSGRTLARLTQPAVMAVLAAEPLHGYVIVRRLAAMEMFRGHGPDMAGVYRLLKSMEESGYVTSAWELAARGPAKRRYQLTPDGNACLARWITTLHTYRNAVDDLLDKVTPRTNARAGGVRGRSAVRRTKRDAR